VNAFTLALFQGCDLAVKGQDLSMRGEVSYSAVQRQFKKYNVIEAQGTRGPVCSCVA